MQKAIKGEPDESEDDGPKVGVTHSSAILQCSDLFHLSLQFLKVPQEIIIKRKLGFSWSQEVGIAVALLTDMDRDDLIDWVKQVRSNFCFYLPPLCVILIFVACTDLAVCCQGTRNFD